MRKMLAWLLPSRGDWRYHANQTIGQLSAIDIKAGCGGGGSLAENRNVTANPPPSHHDFAIGEGSESSGDIFHDYFDHTPRLPPHQLPPFFANTS